MTASAHAYGHVYDATGTPSETITGDEQARQTERELSPHFQAEVLGSCFAPIPGLKIVEYLTPPDAGSKRRIGSGPDLFRRRGFRVVEEPCRGESRFAPPPPPETYNPGAAPAVPGRPGSGWRSGNALAATALLPAWPARENEADAAFGDPRHLMRGSPFMASH